jgi:putative PIN family toxin of toxin-antitoxin system
MMKLVLDTNIVLDMFVFRDVAVRELRDDLAHGKVQWLATASMRQELECVLRYEQIGGRMTAADVSAQQVLAAFDAHANVVEAPPVAPFPCRDKSDQKFIDLAVAHGATLLSKDKQVLALRRKLAARDIVVAKTL